MILVLWLLSALGSDAFVLRTQPGSLLCLTRRLAVLTAPRKEDGWYNGLSTNLGASGKLPDDGQAFADKVAGGANVQIGDTLAMIENAFTYTPVTFTVGEVKNIAGVNEGSCKILSFALLAGLPKEYTLQLFGDAYREVLADPAGTAHGNIRALMKGGMECVSFPNGIQRGL